MCYSVCIIDNDIPASGSEAQALWINDSGLLNASNLRLLSEKAAWEDQVLKNLTDRLLTEKASDGISPKWEVYGFTNPTFYINAIDGGFFGPDLLVFDWEYPGAQPTSGLDPESILRRILERTFCLVFIFSKADKKAKIDEILAKAEFQQYKGRLEYLDKSTAEGEQASTLLRSAERMYTDNFSFRFANNLRKQTVQCADQILSDMGRASLNDVKNLVAVGEGGKKDFIDFLAERFRTSIAGPHIYDLVDQIPVAAAGSPTLDESLAGHIWSYRLYFQEDPGDELVRRGDIVSVDRSCLLVLSADCDLGRFWNKNLGIINAVELHELNQANITLKNLLTVYIKPEKLNGKILSLLGKVGELAEGPFVLPFVPLNGSFRHFVAIPKDLSSIKIPTPTDWKTFTAQQKKEHPMKYSYWAGAERVCTVSEPFLTPIIQHVLKTIAGIGVPDYPEHMTEILKKIVSDFSSFGVAAPGVAAPASQPAKPEMQAAAPAIQAAEPEPQAPGPVSPAAEPELQAVVPAPPVADAEGQAAAQPSQVPEP